MRPSQSLLPLLERLKPDRIRVRPESSTFPTVWEFQSLSSTSDIAQELADADPKGFHVVTALEQTKGRGQHGRTWASRKGHGLLISLVLPKDRPWSRPSLWCAWCATALADLVCHHTSRSARIKWPNDILVQGQKIAGILIEQSIAVVVGIGLNITPLGERSNEPLWENACSLGDFMVPAPTLEEVTEGLLKRLEKGWLALEGGDLQRLEDSFARSLGLVGKQVLLETARESYRGQVRSIGLREIQLDLQERGIRTFSPEEILHIYPVEEGD